RAATTNGRSSPAPPRSPIGRSKYLVPDAAQRVAPLGAERCTADPGPPKAGALCGPGSAAHHYARLCLRHSASKTRVNTLVVLHCARDTYSCTDRSLMLGALPDSGLAGSQA